MPVVPFLPPGSQPAPTASPAPDVQWLMMAATQMQSEGRLPHPFIQASSKSYDNIKDLTGMAAGAQKSDGMPEGMSGSYEDYATARNALNNPDIKTTDRSVFNDPRYSDSTQYSKSYSEDGYAITKRIYGKNGYDQFGRDKNGLTPEENVTPDIDYSQFKADPNKPPEAFSGTKIYKGDKSKAVEIYNKDNLDPNNLSPLLNQIEKSTPMSPGDKAIVTDPDGTRWWFSYRPNHPAGNRDFEDPNKVRPSNKWPQWTPPEDGSS